MGSFLSGKLCMNGSPVSSCSVLIVEDETLLRMMMAEMLEELGHRVAAEAARLEQALPLAQSADFDLAVLDVNVAGQLITPVAELIAARRRPIIFATGYGVSDLPEAFRDRPALRKPFTIDGLKHAIEWPCSRRNRERVAMAPARALPGLQQNRSGAGELQARS